MATYALVFKLESDSDEKSRRGKQKRERIKHEGEQLPSIADYLTIQAV